MHYKRGFCISGEDDMDRNTDDKGLSGIEELDSITQNAVLALGRVIHNAAIYGISHRATTEMMAEAYELSEAIVNSAGRMNFALRNNFLLVGGKLPDNSNPLIKQLYRKMKSKDITAFSIVRGMGLDEFQQLVEVLGSSDSRSFEEQLKSRSLQHVTSEKVVLQEIREGEEIGGGPGKGRGAGSSSDIRDLAEEWLAGNTGIVDHADSEGGGGKGAGGGVEQIVAFLKGDVASDDPQVQAELEKVANDSEKLAELIMEAAAIRQSQSNIQSGETVADLVIGCLRRTFEGLRKAEKNSSDKNIELKKSFMLLEKNIIDKLHRVMGSSDESIDAEIRAAIEEMEDDAELGEIASEYMEQRALMARNEKRIAEYIRGEKGAKLQDRMMAAGMAPESWRSLVAKSASDGGGGSGGGSEPIGGVAESFGALAVVLAKFDDLMTSATPKADEVAKFIDQIEGHVEDVEQNTHQKIDKLNEDMQREIGQREIGPGNAEQRQIRKHREQFSIFVERLAELAQELMQPLTVINCSINMSVSGQLGEISDEQKELLSLAQSNTNRLNRLIEHLTKLVGYPKDLTPKTVEEDEVVISPANEDR